MDSDEGSGANVRSNDLLGVIARGYYHELQDGDWDFFSEEAGSQCQKCVPVVLLSAAEYEMLRKTEHEIVEAAALAMREKIAQCVALNPRKVALEFAARIRHEISPVTPDQVSRFAANRT